MPSLFPPVTEFLSNELRYLQGCYIYVKKTTFMLEHKRSHELGFASKNINELPDPETILKQIQHKVQKGDRELYG